MNSKFYVSLEAARLLKEKGYRDKTMYGYSSEDQSKNALDVREDYDWNDPDDEFHSTETGEYVEMFAAPTKAEAIDWLESKGIVVQTIPSTPNIWRWRMSSMKYIPYDDNTEDSEILYSTRLETEEAAIIKALELL